MKMAIAAEEQFNHDGTPDYRVWFLHLNEDKEVIAIGAKSREELVESIFFNIQQTGTSGWSAMLKNRDRTTEVELYDFITKDPSENTHFGNLPTLEEFQDTLNRLQSNLEIRALAS